MASICNHHRVPKEKPGRRVRAEPGWKSNASSTAYERITQACPTT
jgi:hypothetical protein